MVDILYICDINIKKIDKLLAFQLLININLSSWKVGF